MKLHIGCGYRKFDGFVNIDKSPHVKPDKVVDIEKGLPFENDTFEYIYSKNCLEHVRPQYWSYVLNEIARVAQDGCILELVLPFDNIGNRTNCDHYRTFSFNSFSQMEQSSKRNYFSDLKLVRLSRYHSKLEILFFNMFPFLKQHITYKYKIIK
jgi:ubiquinone/menaquinone biosynthesis C-methylase UbiE